MATILRGVGAHVLVADPYVDPGYAAPAEVTDLDDLLARSAFVTVHARATPATSGMISREAIARMPAVGVLVNGARGSLVDYDAVCDALDNGHLFGAAVDVSPVEPVPADSRLLTTPHLVMTPHLAGASRQTATNAARIIAADVGRWTRGEPLAHEVLH